MSQRQRQILTKQSGVMWRQLGARQESSELTEIGVRQEIGLFRREKVGRDENVKPVLTTES